MHTIKKYANRKLYHTNQKQYITLEGIARLVQSGESVQVLDNETGEDITSSILSQVVLQSRGSNAIPLPTNLLTGIIQLGGDTLTSLRKTLFSSLGGADMIETEIGRRIDVLVGAGELSPDESTRWRQMLLRSEFSLGAPDGLSGHADEVPSRRDVVQLHAQVDALAAVVDQLLQQRKP